MHGLTMWHLFHSGAWEGEKRGKRAAGDQTQMDHHHSMARQDVVKGMNGMSEHINESTSSLSSLGTSSSHTRPLSSI